MPSVVEGVRVTSQSPTQLTIKWNLPEKTNGVITEYEVELKSVYQNVVGESVVKQVTCKFLISN